MQNPFDDEGGTFHVLRNDRGEFSLWPTFAAVPAGWQPVVTDATRADALTHVEQHWTTLRPEHYAGAEPVAATDR